MLSEEQIQKYRKEGYVLAHSVLSASEAADLREECHELVQRLSRSANLDATWGSVQNATASTTVLHRHNVQFYVAHFARLLLDQRITVPASQLMGSPNVQLHHCKMFIKPPERGSPFPMHQDYPYFPHERNTMLAAVVHFDDSTIEKGCLRVMPGSHLGGPLRHLSQQDFHLPEDLYPVESAMPIEAEAGDVLYFNYLTIHGSGINSSSEARTTLLIQMRDPQDSPLQETHESRGQGMMLRGIDPNPKFRGVE